MSVTKERFVRGDRVVTVVTTDESRVVDWNDIDVCIESDDSFVSNLTIGPVRHPGRIVTVGSMSSTVRVGTIIPIGPSLGVVSIVPPATVVRVISSLRMIPSGVGVYRKIGL
jgi:hypothetical protein